MESNRAEGNWTQVKGKIREEWGKLKSDDLDRFKSDVIRGKGEQLAGKIQETYGIAKEEAQRKLDRIKDRCNC